MGNLASGFCLAQSQPLWALVRAGNEPRRQELSSLLSLCFPPKHADSGWFPMVGIQKLTQNESQHSHQGSPLLPGVPCGPQAWQRPDLWGASHFQSQWEVTRKEGGLKGNRCSRVETATTGTEEESLFSLLQPLHSSL